MTKTPTIDEGTEVTLRHLNERVIELEDDVRELVANLDGETLGEVALNVISNMNVGDQLTFTECIIFRAAAERLKDG